MPATPYVTPQSLVDEFGERELIELTDRATPRTGEVDTAVAQRACDRAIAEIDAVLLARYRLPLSAVPALIPFLARDLARYYLYEVEPSTVVQTRYETALRTLRAISDGKQSLGLDEAGAAPVADTPLALPEFSAGDKAFARSSRW